MANIQTEIAVKELCEWIAAHPKCTRSELFDGIHQQRGKSNNADQLSESTLYRWLSLGIQRNLIKRIGHTSNACYEASDKLRVEILHKNLNVEHSKRARVGYNENWLEEYEPNKTSYLKKSDIARLHERCRPGDAPIEKINGHDLSIFMCDLVYASSRLEGNNYDYANTIQLLEYDLEMNNGSLLDKTVILNHRDAVRYIIDSTRDRDPSFGVNAHVTRGLHAILSHNLLKDPMQCGGLRTEHVDIFDSSYIPLDKADLIANYFEQILNKSSKIIDPYEKSFFLLVHIPYLQPFMDCNKRTSRLVCNIPLLQNGITPISWIDATNRSKEYTQATIATYEHNDTILLSEMYIDSFMRSTERFSLMQRQRNPDPIAVKYRNEIKTFIRTKILDDTDAISPNIKPADINDFILYIDNELDIIKKNNMIAIRYGLTPEIITAWAQKLENQELMEAQALRPKER